jgi:uncharacterized protein YegL
MSELLARVNDANPDPRIACVLLLDTSWSMNGDPVAELNRGFETFCGELKDDPLAKKRTEVAVITFGGTAQLVTPFMEARQLEPQHFTASGGTPMGSAINLALDEVQAQKAAYKQAGLEYFRPWIFLLSDGAPTDGQVFDAAVDRIKQVEAAKGVTVFAVGVGDLADLAQLQRVSPSRQPLMLNGYKFTEMFQWLSASMQVVSDSSAFGSSDGAVAEAEETEQQALPSPAGWATW